MTSRLPRSFAPPFVLILATIVVVVGSGPACSRKPSSTSEGSPAASVSGHTEMPTSQQSTATDAASRVVFDPLVTPAECTLGHRGVLLDLGTASGDRHVSSRARAADMKSVERDGATFARVASRSASFTVFATSEDVVGNPGAERPAKDGLAVSLRIRAGTAKSVVVVLNGKTLGTAVLPKDETAVVSVRSATASLAGGANDVTLQFRGAPTKGDPGVVADVDWIHLGDADVPASLWAPTFATSFATASLGGVARPAISLRTPGFARCTTWIPDGATLALRVGASAPPGKEKEETTARVRLLRDRMAPVVLATSKFPSSKSEWSEMRVVVPSTSGNGMLATLEFAAVTGPDGSRVHFAEPRLTVPATPRVPPPPPVRGVVIVVASGVSTKSLAAYGGPLALPTLDALAGESVVFSAHRGSSAHASGNLASAITGALPRSHGVTDGDARLPEGVPTLAEIVRRAGIATGFFSAHPGTSAPFGFARGWDQSASYAPTESASAKRPFEDAAKFVDAHKDGRFLVVVHARAGHPPWDLTAEELRSIGPPGYTGPVDPRSAGELLARPARSTARLSDADRTRAMALHTRALLDQDAEFGTLLAAIKAAKRDVDTEIIFTGDVAMDESSPSPYAEGDVTDEAVLGLPLVVRRPAVPPARVATPTNPTDVAASVLGAFGLALPRDFVGVTFEDARADGSAHEGRVLVAESEGRFSLRRGSLVLLGSGDRDFRLCDLTLEPACVTDVRATYPLAHESMRSAAFDGLGTPEGRHAREPAPIDVATASSLRAWGR